MNPSSKSTKKEVRHYTGALLIFLFIIGLVVVLIQFPVLDSNKEVVMMLIGSLTASLAMVISTITGSKPDDISAMRNKLESREQQIESLTKSKDEYESMIIRLQKQIIKNQEEMVDRFLLKSAMEFDDKNKK
jgi:low affinity Fe/Cu permease